MLGPIFLRPLALRPTAVCFLLGCALGIAACAVNPQSGRREVILMSEETERKIDEEAAKQVEQQLGLIENEQLTAYVAELGRQLASHALRRDVDYVFSVVEMEEPNAFALPGGHIYVSRGLVQLVNSEAELANVIGHEIGHVTSRHAAQRDARQKAGMLLSVLGAVAAAVAGQAQVAGALGQFGAFGVPGLLAAYGRSQEREADEIGQELARQAGVDPAGMADFLRTLDNHTRLAMGATRLPSFFDTHPATPERVAETATRAQLMHWQPDFAIAASRAEFLAKIDGMPVGKPAREGILDNGRLLHPDLGFTVRFPAGWKVQNSRARVIAGAPDRDAVVLLELDGPGDDPRAAAAAYAQREKVRYFKAFSLILGELRAYRVRTAIQTPQGLAASEVTWIAYDGNIYRLTAAAISANFRKYEGSFRSFARSFRALREDERADIREIRLRIATALPGETLAELSKRVENTWDLNRTAVVNAFRLGAPLREGQLVKVAVAEPYTARADSVDEAEVAAGP